MPTAKCQPPNANRQHGVISIAAIVVIASAAFLVGSAFVVFALSELQHGFFGQNAQVALFAADSCVEEALYRLRGNGSFATGTLAVGEATCTLLVTSSGSTRNISASSTFQDFLRIINATSTLSGSNITLNDWSQYAGY